MIRSRQIGVIHGKGSDLLIYRIINFSYVGASNGWIRPGKNEPIVLIRAGKSPKRGILGGIPSVTGELPRPKGFVYGLHAPSNPKLFKNVFGVRFDGAWGYK